MKNGTQRDGKAQHPLAPSPMVLEVEVRHPQRDCLLYSWNRELTCLQVMGIHRAEAGLPADLGVIHLEGKKEVLTFLLLPYSAPPGTLVSARLVGAVQDLSFKGTKDDILPIDGWILVAVAEVDASLASCFSLDQLPPAQLVPLKAYVQAGAGQNGAGRSEVATCAAEAAARLVRETRLFLKRELREHSPGKGWPPHKEEERPVAWRAIEGLSAALRTELLKETTSDGIAPHAQTEYLIRFVPQRFQHALGDLLLDDERLLAFIERPLLRHRTGWLGVQTWRSNEGLFLLTDRQVLWLRDFLSPGANFLEGGYIAHSAPLERLRSITLLAAGEAPEELAVRLDSRDSPYLRLVLEVESKRGTELFVIEFPAKPEAEKALAYVIGLLRGFLPCADPAADRRVRRLPVVEVWQPQGLEAERLAGLGGIVPAEVKQRLEQQLVTELDSSGEEALVSALIPALEDYHSPARLIALTRGAVLVLEEVTSKSRSARRTSGGPTVQPSRYEFTAISSAQLRYSLVGAALSLFVPQPDGHTHQQVIPFNSPAIAWFLPLFTRLRVSLAGPYRE
jgi:hypothetical protein